MSSVKGNRSENKAQKAYERAGYWCYRPHNSKFGDNDLWNLFDLAAFHPHLREIRFVQVKTNRGKGIGKWARKAYRFARVGGVQVDYVVRYDDEGWRVLKPSLDGQSHHVVADTRELDLGPTDHASGVDRGLSMWLRGELDDER